MLRSFPRGTTSRYSRVMRGCRWLAFARVPSGRPTAHPTTTSRGGSGAHYYTGVGGEERVTLLLDITHLLDAVRIIDLLLGICVNILLVVTTILYVKNKVVIMFERGEVSSIRSLPLIVFLPPD